MSDIVNCDMTTMKKCKYGCYLDSSQYVCDYYVMTGTRRPCPASECTCFKPKKEKIYQSPFGKKNMKRRFINRKSLEV